MRRKLLSLFLVVIMLFGFSGCIERAKDYTEEEHMERVSKIVREKYVEKYDKYTDFEIYPLYNENEEYAFFLVELQPENFIYVGINPLYNSLKQKFFGPGMYSGHINSFWQKYTLGEDEKEVYEVDENGEPIYYYHSHFKVAGIENEKRYLLKIERGYIPAVKRGDKFLNLVSMEEMELGDENQPTAFMEFIFHKNNGDLDKGL